MTPSFKFADMTVPVSSKIRVTEIIIRLMINLILIHLDILNKVSLKNICLCCVKIFLYRAGVGGNPDFLKNLQTPEKKFHAK